MPRKGGDLAHDGHVSLWHAWRDKPGIRQTPSYWKNQGIISTQYDRPLYAVTSLEEAISTIAHNELFVLCNDILDVRDIPYANEAIGDKRTTPYLTRSGRIPAMRVSEKRHTGFLIPAVTWGWKDAPDKLLVEHLCNTFKLFGYQSTTPASLSEKVLRSTLPYKLSISRPSQMLRKDILDNHTGGRIDKAEAGTFYKTVIEYDKNKAYLYHSRNVVSPFLAPVCLYHPRLSDIGDYPACWLSCTLVAHNLSHIAPIQVDGRDPVEGEVIEKWLWSGELLDCLEAGYTLIDIYRGYGFREMSNFMEQWSDILWEAWWKCRNRSEHEQQIIKSMMVGVPGRFLRQPEEYLLIHKDQAQAGDIPIRFSHIEPDQPIFTDYVVHPVYDKEATALSPVGSYIVAEMRRELYHKMKEEEEHGHHVIRAYIDCYSIEPGSAPLGDSDSFRVLGSALGQYKEKRYTNVYAEENRFIGVKLDADGVPEPFPEMRAPGFSKEQRIELWKIYRKVLESEGIAY